jgi:hypothetical protein
MQAGKAEKQPPTHSTGDTAHAESVVVLQKKKKKRGYTVCSSGYAATDTS